MRVLSRTLIALAIGVALVAIAAAVLAWQLPALHGTITIGDAGMTLHGFDDPDGDNAGLAMALAGIAVVGIALAVGIAVVTAIVVGLGAAALGIAVALAAVAGSLLLVASPLLLIGWLVWLALRRPRDRPAAHAAIAAS